MLIPIAEIRDPEVQALCDEATRFILGFRWCRSLREVKLGFAIGGVLGVFQVDIVPDGPEVDERLLLLVGDIPPAYVIAESGDSWQHALQRYVDEMQGWSDAASRGESVSELIPVTVPATPEYARLLASRLSFLRERLLGSPASEFTTDV